MNDFTDTIWRLRRKLLDVRTDLAALRVEFAFRRYASEAKYNSNQPRVPRGHPDGGQWTGGGGGSSRPMQRAPITSQPRAATAPTAIVDQIRQGAMRAVFSVIDFAAPRVRDAIARVQAWTDKNMPGGLDVMMQVPSEATRIMIALGGPEAVRQYEDLSDKMERGGEEAARAYRQRMDGAVESGVITRQQADNATVLVTTAVAAGAVLPVGKVGRAARTVGQAERATLRIAPKIERLRGPARSLPGTRKYKVGDNHIVLTPTKNGDYDVAFEIRQDYGAVKRSADVRRAQELARARGGPDDAGFHTMAHRFFPGLKEPITAGNSVLNRATWRSMENEIGRLVKAGRSVNGTVRVAPSKSGRPSAFVVEYHTTIDGRPVTTNRTFKNTPSGKAWR